MTEGSLLRSNIFTIGETFIKLASKMQPFYKRYELNTIALLRCRAFGTILNYVLPLAKVSLCDKEPPTIASDGPPAFEGRQNMQQPYFSK